MGEKVVESGNTKKPLTKKIIDIRAYSMIIAFVLIALLFSITTNGVFLTNRNISNLLRQMSIVTILAAGVFFPILSANIDMSVGSLMGMLGGIAAIVQAKFGFGTFEAIIVMLILGALIGLFQGALVSYVKVPAFIVTLGGYMVYRGVLILITGGKSIPIVNKSFTYIGQAYIGKEVGIIIAAAIFIFAVFNMLQKRNSRIKYGLPVPSIFMAILKLLLVGVLIAAFTFIMNSYEGIPLPVLIMLVVVGVFTVLAEKTEFGRSVYAIGGNSQAATYSGIPVKRNTMFTFMISGLLTAIGAVILTSRLNAGTPSAGTMAEMDAIAAAVIGGASLAGGVGRVPGVIIGAIIMASIDNGMSLMNMDSYWQYIIKGAILVIAVAIDVLTNKKGS